MIIGEVLSDGFAAAHRNVALIFLDLLWKALWLILTLAAILVLAWWFGSEFASIEWPDASRPLITPWLVAIALRQFWDEHAAGLVFGVCTASVVSAAIWLFLESFFRKAIFQRLALSPWERAGAPSARLVRVTLAVFLATRFVKLTILAAVASALVLVIFGSYLHTPLAGWPALWPDTRAALVAGLIVMAAVSYLLTIIETLLRSSAIELLGTHLVQLAGLMATLLLFEGMIGASLMITVALGLLYASSLAEIFFMLFAGAAAFLLWNCVHSYLLLVRYSAVDIMRHDVTAI